MKYGVVAEYKRRKKQATEQTPEQAIYGSGEKNLKKKCEREKEPVAPPFVAERLHWNVQINLGSKTFFAIPNVSLVCEPPIPSV